MDDRAAKLVAQGIDSEIIWSQQQLRKVRNAAYCHRHLGLTYPSDIPTVGETVERMISALEAFRSHYEEHTDDTD